MATPAAQNEIVNRAFQSVTGLTPEAASGPAPVSYQGEARQTVDQGDAFAFGAAQPYSPPSTPENPAKPASSPPAPLQVVPVNSVVSVPTSDSPASTQPVAPTFPTGKYWDQNYYNAQMNAGNTSGAQKYIDYVTSLNQTGV
jgi:hypothetical protein